MVFTGLGYSAIVSGCVCGLGYYFHTYRDTVMSLGFLVPGIAMFIGTPLTLLMLDGVALNGTFFIYGAMVAHICLCGTLIKPSKVERQVHSTRKAQTVGVDGAARNTCHKYLDLSLLKNGPFLLYLLSVTAWCFAFNACQIHLPNYVIIHGGDALLTGQVMMAFGVGNILGRLLGVLTVSRFKHRSVHVYIIVLGVSGILTAMCPLYGHYTMGLYVFAVQLGVSTGLAYSVLVVIALSFTDISRLSESHGLSFMFSGFGLVSGPIVIGYLYSVTGSYRNTFIAAGVALLIGSACGLASLCLKQRSNGDTTRELDIQLEGEHSLMIENDQGKVASSSND